MMSKTTLTLLVVLVLTLSFVAPLAAAAPLHPQAPNQTSELLGVLFPPEFIKALAGLLLVIVLDLALGVSAAIKSKVFAWSKMGDFYRSSVVPNLLGWAVADILLRIGAYYQLPVISQLQPLGTVALYALVMVALLGQIGSKLVYLRSDLPAASTTK